MNKEHPAWLSYHCQDAVQDSVVVRSKSTHTKRTTSLLYYCLQGWWRHLVATFGDECSVFLWRVLHTGLSAQHFSYLRRFVRSERCCNEKHHNQKLQSCERSSSSSTVINSNFHQPAGDSVPATENVPVMIGLQCCQVISQTCHLYENGSQLSHRTNYVAAYECQHDLLQSFLQHSQSICSKMIVF